MAEIAGLLVRLEATTALLRNEMRNAERAVDNTARKIERDVNRIDDAVTKMGAGMAAAIKGGLAGLAAGLTVGAIGQAVAHVTNLAAELDKASKASGISVENFQRFDAAMRASGLGVGQFQDAITELMPNLGEAISDRAGGASDAFEKMGIALRDAQGNVRSTDKILLDVADALAKVPSAAERAAIASKLFGEEAGPKMAVALGQGSEAIEKLGADANILSNDMVEKALEVQREWANVGAVLQTELAAAILEIIPTAETLRDVIIAISDEIESWQAPMNRSAGYIKREIGEKQGELAAIKARRSEAEGGMFGAWANETEDFDGQIRDKEAEIRALEARVALLDRDAQLRREERAGERGNRGGAHTSKPTGSGKTDEERAAEKRAKYLDDLRFETAQIGLNSDAIEVNKALREAGVSAQSAEGQEIARLIGVKQEAKRAEELWNDEREKSNERQQAANALIAEARTPLEAYNAEVERLMILLNEGAISQGTFLKGVLMANDQMAEAKKKLAGTSETVKILEDAGGRAFDRIGSSITDAFTRGEASMISFRSIGLGVVSELMQAFIELSAVAPLKAGLKTVLEGAAAGFAGGWAGSSPTITRTGRAAVPNYDFDLLPARAGGGGVQAGQPYVVGELRPELFVPSVSGTIKPFVPNMGAGRAANVNAAPQVGVTQHMNFALGVSSTVRAEIAGMMPQIAQASRAAMLDSQARRGRSL